MITTCYALILLKLARFQYCKSFKIYEVETPVVKWYCTWTWSSLLLLIIIKCSIMFWMFLPVIIIFRKFNSIGTTHVAKKLKIIRVLSKSLFPIACVTCLNGVPRTEFSLDKYKRFYYLWSWSDKILLWFYFLCLFKLMKWGFACHLHSLDMEQIRIRGLTSVQFLRC